jgi:hypothetical protein
VEWRLFVNAPQNIVPTVVDAPEPEVDLVLQPGELEIWPSFETCSYYFYPMPEGGEGEPAKEYAVEFRKAGEDEWRPTFETISDLPVGVWKGSIFGLEEDTDWELRVLAGSAGAGADVAGGDVTPIFHGMFRTWTSNPPIARTVDLSELAAGSPDGIVISEHGAPDGWIRYTAPEGWVLRRQYDSNDTQDAVITLDDARYVILENITIVGGYRYAIRVHNCESVRILNCEISGWGRYGVQNFGKERRRGMYYDDRGLAVNLDAGIEIDRSWRTVVERCYIHDPRHRANSWMFTHPAGPTAVHVRFTRGGTVLRWNDFIGSDEHRWNDVVESSANRSEVGGFYRDSDITGNYLSFANDDGIELEGGGMNVRFYGNKIEGTLCGVSTGACILGPQYIFNNLIANPGDESGLALWFFKNGHGVMQGGKRYHINNTLYGFYGRLYHGYGKWEVNHRRGFMRNNVISCNRSGTPDKWAAPDNFNHDLFWVENDLEVSREFVKGWQQWGQEQDAVVADPQLVNPDDGDFHLGPHSVARGKAVPVTNICPPGSDMGAFNGKYTELPHRPLGFVAEPRQLKFDENTGSWSREVTLTLPATEKQPVKFQIRKNRVFDWFQVEPSSGEIKPGEPLKLTVRVDRGMVNSRALFKGAFLVRTAEGLSRPVTVYAAGKYQEELRPPEAPNTIYVEAASIAGTEPYVSAATAPNVVGGKQVALNGAERTPRLNVEFEIAKPGRYGLMARLGNEDDVMQGREFELTLNEAEAPETFIVNADYQWSAGLRSVRVVFLHDLGDLEAGKHQLQLVPTQGNFNLNEIIITDNPGVFFVQHWQRERE